MRTPRMRLLRRSWTAALTAAGSVALLVSGFIATPTSAAEAGCRVDYTVNQWAGGYTAQVKVTNLGPAVNGWRLTWTHADGQRVTSAWNATVTQAGASVVAVNTGWNGSLATGGSAEFGVQGTWSSANPAPTDFALNGVVCGGTGTTPPPTTPPTTPPPTTPPPSADCGSAVVCSGFEDQTGTTPSGAWQFAAPDCQGAPEPQPSTPRSRTAAAGRCGSTAGPVTATTPSSPPRRTCRRWGR